MAKAVRSIGARQERAIGPGAMPNQFAYHRWRKEFGGLKTYQIKRPKERGSEASNAIRPGEVPNNERLREAVVGSTLGKPISKEAAPGTEGPRSKTSKPRPPPPMYRTCPAEGPDFGTALPSRSRSASLHAAQGAEGAFRGGRAHGGHHRVRQSAWLPTDRGGAARCGLGGEHQALLSADLRCKSPAGQRSNGYGDGKARRFPQATE